jgi:C_GCAxxG_C_C family probable redox protein
MGRPENIEALAQRAKTLTAEGKLSCSEATLRAMAEYWGIESPLIPRIATPFRGGLCGTQQVCGAVTGGLMALGMRMGRDAGTENSDACLEKGRAFMRAVREEYGSLACLDITGLDRTDPAQEEKFHGRERIELCVRLVMRCCRWLAENVE